MTQHQPKSAARRGAPLATSAPAPFEPRYPGLIATACFSLWIAILSLPMLSGAFIATPLNDQYSSGYAYRAWAAEWTGQLGHVPLWNPAIFGGMPFVAGMHGDIFYPTAWLRLIMPTYAAMNLGFVIHYVLAGLFTYWFLRRWKVSWAGAVVGGLAFQLSGVIASYVSPGHDGKLFVTAMLPLMLVGLTIGIRDRRLHGYAITALAVGLIMLSPHPQMALYALLAAGIFTLYLVFGEGSAATGGGRERLTAMGLALLAVLVGVGVSALQYMPFYAYIPFSPRDESRVQEFAWSAAYAIPWSHFLELVVPRFTGETFNRSYWGPNGLKLHSEYLGLAATGLAAYGAFDRSRRRMVLWLAGIALLFLLIALGASTPFYRLWWEIVPFAKSMRAPGMALFIVSFVVATLAAFGTDRLFRQQTSRFATVALAVGGLVALLGVTGGFGAMAESLGTAVERTLGYPERGAYAATAAATLRWAALGAGLALAAVGATAALLARGSLTPAAAGFALVAIVGTDLWLNASAFWNYSNAHRELFAEDPLKRQLQTVPRPFRVWDVEDGERGVPSVYPGAALMEANIAQLYGHHGNELHTFDALNGRQGSSLAFSRAGHPQLLELYAINHLIVHAAAAPESIPGFRRVLSDVQTSAGAPASLFERTTPVPYARFVPAGIQASLEQTVPTVVDPRFPIDQIVLLDSAAGAPTEPPNPLPAAIPHAIQFTEWVPGRMRMTIEGGARAAGYILVSENYYRDWRATVDGRDVNVARGNGSLITVPVTAGAREIDLRFVSREYQTGRLISLMSLALIALGLIVPLVLGRRRGASGDSAGDAARAT